MEIIHVKCGWAARSIAQTFKTVPIILSASR
jgi:hypothetical protein